MVNDAELQARRLIDFDPGLLQLYALPVSVKESVEIKVRSVYAVRIALGNNADNLVKYYV